MPCRAMAYLEQVQLCGGLSLQSVSSRRTPRHAGPGVGVFSALELMEALAACSSLLSPGPDHVTWVHLKKIVAEPQCLNVFIKLANACLTVGHWPKHLKESVSVIIPKPRKPSYSAPKAFRPIALLNTLGKLIEKMLSNRIQHDMIAYDIVDPNQFGGIRQRSTKDAGLYLTHLVRTGWARGLKTSVTVRNRDPDSVKVFAKYLPHRDNGHKIYMYID